MNSICDKHLKDAKFKCCVIECSQLMCTQCLVHPHQESSALFYCNSCVSKNKNNAYIALCQPVTNASSKDPEAIEGEDEYLCEDLSQIRVELFPAATPLLVPKETSNEEMGLAVAPALSPTHLVLPKETSNEEQRLAVVPALADTPLLLRNETSNEDQRLAVVPALAQMNEEFPLAQTMNETEIDTDNLEAVHLPSWYIESMTADLEPLEIHKSISKRCWLTEELQEEIRSYYPTRDEIRMNPTMGDCVRDLEAFKRKCSILFPVGRVFLSHIQLVQALKHFLDGWNVKKVHHGKKVRCYFSDTGRKKESTCDQIIRRNIPSSVKKQYNCPFEIRYSFMGVIKHKKVPFSFYKVKITWCNYNHSCQLSSIFYKTATQLSRGKMKLDLNGMNTLLMLLKSNPAIDTRSLRSLLLEYVHKDVSIDSTYIRNFRQRVAYFHAANPSYTDLTITEANSLLEMNPLSAEEHNVLDNPVIRINFKEMLLKIMAEDSSTWEALAFLRRCKEEIPGFDFRIRLNERNHPCSLVFTTSNGRNNAIRYGDVISLDMQHRQHNKHNWPYFGPVVKTSDMSIGVICEAIVISETIDSYAWVLKKMVEMEP